MCKKGTPRKGPLGGMPGGQVVWLGTPVPLIVSNRTMDDNVTIEFRVARGTAPRRPKSIEPLGSSSLRCLSTMATLPRLHVVLYQPEIPQNTGNVGRTCVAVAAKLWIVRPCGFRLDDRRLRRAGLDYWQHLDYEAVATWDDLRSRLEGHRFWYFTRHASRPVWEAEFSTEDVLVFGSETQGLPASLLAAEDSRALVIPTTDRVRSLNLSNAVAVAAFEALRQFGSE